MDTNDSSLFNPPGTPGVGDPADRPMGSIIRLGDASTNADVGIVGIPFDTSVLGRRGARFGPDAIRRALARAGSFALSFGVDLAEDLTIADFGDVPAIPTDVAETHRRVEASVGTLAQRGIVPCVLGGDHGTSFATIKAVAAGLGGRIGVVQIDAHLDVRRAFDGVISSGTPFRRLLELGGRSAQPSATELDGPLRPENLAQVGIADWRNARAYVEECRHWGTRIITAREVHRDGVDLAARLALSAATLDTEGFFLSFDLDALDVPFAPGVSAHSPGGLTSAQAIELVWQLARHPACRGFDVVECAPPLDVQDWTAELAATLVLTFLAGVVSQRRGASH